MCGTSSGMFWVGIFALFKISLNSHTCTAGWLIGVMTAVMSICLFSGRGLEVSRTVESLMNETAKVWRAIDHYSRVVRGSPFYHF
jgi:hypothetical protein